MGNWCMDLSGQIEDRLLEKIKKTDGGSEEVLKTHDGRVNKNLR